MVIAVFNLGLLLGDAAVLWLAARSRRLRTSLGATLGLLLLGSLLAFVAGVNLWERLRLLFFVVFLHAPLVGLGLAWLLRGSAPRTGRTALVISLVLLAMALDGGFIEPNWLEVSHLTVADPRIPRALRLAVLTDFQTDHIGGFERRVLRRILAEKPDVVLLLGDYIQTRRSEYDAVNRQFHDLLAAEHFSAPLGVYAVQGNVDPQRWQDAFTGLPITILPATSTFEAGGVAFTGLAVDASFDPRLQLPRPGDGFHVTFGHAPNYALGTIDADLLLAGHTHGGQLRLPGIGAVFNLSLVPRSWSAGVTRLSDGRTLVVARGTGMERGRAPRARFLCRPEVVVVDLKPAAP